MAGIKFLSLFPILDSSAETLVTIIVASLHFFNGINYFSHIFIINTKRYKDKTKKLLLLGQTKEKIAACCDRHGFTDYEFVSSLEEAVLTAASEALPGECVLLSPACASWGMFKNFEERGDRFRELVNTL